MPPLYRLGDVLRKPCLAVAQGSSRIGAVIRDYDNLALKSASLAHISVSLALPRLDFARFHRECYASDDARSLRAAHGYTVFNPHAETPNVRHKIFGLLMVNIELRLP
jgi:hypothetical protein